MVNKEILRVLIFWMEFYKNSTIVYAIGKFPRRKLIIVDFLL